MSDEARLRIEIVDDTTSQPPSKMAEPIGVQVPPLPTPATFTATSFSGPSVMLGGTRPAGPSGRPPDADESEQPQLRTTIPDMLPPLRMQPRAWSVERVSPVEIIGPTPFPVTVVNFPAGQNAMPAPPAMPAMTMAQMPAPTLPFSNLAGMAPAIAQGNALEATALLARTATSVALPLAAVGISAHAVVSAFQGTVKAFNEKTEQLAYLSPDIAGARATATVRSLLGDVRQAQELGPSLARLTDSQSRLEVAIKEAMTPLQKVLADQVAGALNDIRLILKGAEPATNAIASAIPKIISGVDRVADINSPTYRVLKSILEILRRMGATAEAKERQEEIDLASGFLKQLGDQLYVFGDIDQVTNINKPRPLPDPPDVGDIPIFGRLNLNPEG